MIRPIAMKLWLFFTTLIFLLLPCKQMVAAENISLGGLRQVIAEIDKDSDSWQVKINMIPVKCFTPLVNKNVTRNYAKRYALTALAVSLDKRSLSAKQCNVISDSFEGDRYSAVFRISGLAFPASQPLQAAPQIDSSLMLSGDLLNRKNDWINTLTSFSHVLGSEINSIEKESFDLDHDSLFLKIADLEETGIQNYTMLLHKIESDKMLLGIERQELSQKLVAEKSNFLTRLQHVAKTHSPVLPPNDFSDVNIENDFAPYLYADLQLMEYGGAKLYELSKKRFLLISVGMAEVHSQSIKELIRQKKAAKLHALSALLKMTGVHVTSVSVLTDKTIVHHTQNGQREIENLETLFELTKEEAEGKIRALPVIGTWYSKDKTIFYTALGEFINYE